MPHFSANDLYREDNIGFLCCLGQEQVLNHKEWNSIQSFLNLCPVRIGDNRVLSGDIKKLYSAAGAAVDNRCRVHAACGRMNAKIGSTLAVVLLAKDQETTPFFAELAGQDGKIGERLCQFFAVAGISKTQSA